MKKVLKFRFEGKEGFLSVVESNEAYYALVQKDTPKVAHIKNSNQLEVSHELKTPVFAWISAKILEDFKIITWVYETLEKENNLYFKQLDDTLCVIEIAK